MEKESFLFCSTYVAKTLSLMLFCSKFMGLGRGIQTHTHTHTFKKQSCPASASCNPSDKLQCLLLFSSPTSLLASLSSSSCNWIWIKMAFPFLLHSFPLWLKRDLPGEITHKDTHTNTHTRSQQRDVAFEGNIFTNKRPPWLALHPSLPSPPAL